MTTTPTFRVADGMLVENARMEKPMKEDYYELGIHGIQVDQEWYDSAVAKYNRHLASLRSIPIAPGCVFEKQDGLVMNKDFKVCYERRSTTSLDIETKTRDTEAVAISIKPPARAFSLAEALEIGYDSLVKGMNLAEGVSFGTGKYVATKADLDAHLKTYFKQRFNIEL